MYGLFDTGSNATLLNSKLAEQLGLNVEEHNSNVRVAFGANAHFVGWLPRPRLQLHDSLAIIVWGLQFIIGAANHMSIVLKTVVFDLRGSIAINVT